ncbi:MAG: FecR domain-containing protein [Gemmatimonadaceae bacterium]
MMKNNDDRIPPELADEHGDLADLAVQLANEELPAERVAELSKRLATDPVFRAVAEPILDAWKAPPLTDAEMAREWPEFRRRAGIADLEALESRDDPELAAYVARVRERTRAQRWRRVLGVAAILLLVVGLPVGRDAFDERFNWMHIETGAIETTTARLPDSTTVTVYPDSRLSFQRGMGMWSRRAVRLRGRAEYQMRSRSGGGEPLEIRTATARLTPFYSNATVTAFPDATEIVVHRGTVLVYALDEEGEPARQVVRVEQGEVARVADGIVRVGQGPSREARP